MNGGLETAIGNMKFDHLRIAVIGDVMLDRFIQGVESPRINPENPAVPILIATEDFFLGGAANVARNVTALGAKCDIYGVVGGDLYGREIERLCGVEEVRSKLVFDDAPTIVKERIFVNGVYKYRSDLGEKELKKATLDTRGAILDSLRSDLGRYKAVVISDYDKRLCDADFVQEVIRFANSENIPVLADPKPSNIDFFRGCTVVCPNKTEAEKITGIKYENNSSTLSLMAQSIRERVNCRYVVITCGEDGSYVFHDGQSEMEGTVAKNVVDFTGAGDTYAASLLCGLSSGLNIFQSAKIANIAAGLVVEKYGTATTSVEDILERYRE